LKGSSVLIKDLKMNLNPTGGVAQGANPIKPFNLSIAATQPAPGTTTTNMFSANQSAAS
jgi:hypothetical protein